MNLIVSNDLSIASTDSITGTPSIAQGKTLYTNNNLVLKSTAAGTARAELPVDGSGKCNGLYWGVSVLSDSYQHASVDGY